MTNRTDSAIISTKHITNSNLYQRFSEMKPTNISTSKSDSTFSPIVLQALGRQKKPYQSYFEPSRHVICQCNFIQNLYQHFPVQYLFIVVIRPIFLTFHLLWKWRVLFELVNTNFHFKRFNGCLPKFLLCSLLNLLAHFYNN